MGNRLASNVSRRDNPRIGLRMLAPTKNSNLSHLGEAIRSIASSVRRRVNELMLAQRQHLLIAIQLALVIASSYVAFLLRFDGEIPPTQWLIFRETLLLLVAIRIATFIPLRLFSGLWQYTDISDVGNIILAVALSSGVAYVLLQGVLGVGYSRSVLIIDSVLLVLALCGVRLIPRLARLRRRKKGHKRIIIYGAGDAGEMIVRDMRESRIGYVPLGFVDDDPSKFGERIHGIPVLGRRARSRGSLMRRSPHEVLIAMPGADHRRSGRSCSSLQPFKMPIKTLPELRDIIGRPGGT